MPAGTLEDTEFWNDEGHEKRDGICESVRDIKI